MANLFPDINRTRVIFASRAEEFLYDQCRKQLDNDWNVFFSCTITAIDASEGLVDSEIDFVLYHKSYGCIVIEVKGGRIRFDAEKSTYYSVNRAGREFQIRDPFKQALVWKSRFIRALRKISLRIPVAHAVCFPTVDESEFPENSAVEKQLIIGRQRIGRLDQSLKQLATRAHPPEFLRFQDVVKPLTEYLHGTAFSSRLYLRDYIDSHELRVKDFEMIQETLLTPVITAKRLGIEGEAGTGKTMLALMAAKYLCDQGMEVILFTSSPLLAKYLLESAPKLCQVTTYNDFAMSYSVDLLKTPAKYDSKPEDWVQYDGPEHLKKSIIQGEKRYDAIICDEAQDVQPFWWEAFESALRSGEKSRFYVFFDRSQGVFGSGGKQQSFVPEEVLPVASPYFPLVHNYRTTREIASFSRAFRTGKEVLSSHCGRFGYVPEIIAYSDAQDCRKKLGKLLRFLIRDELLKTSEVAILSARSPFSRGSVLNNVSEISHYPLTSLNPKRVAWPVSEGKIGVGTVAGFKGMETHVGILINFSEYNLPAENAIMSSLIYVACTRAKHMLYIFVQKDDSKLQAFQNGLNAITANGALVIEGSQADFEFIGEVTEFDRNRFGWLKVDDPAFQRNTVMFFPYDCDSAIEDIKVGKKLRFRPRVLAGISFATHLQIVEDS